MDIYLTDDDINDDVLINVIDEESLTHCAKLDSINITDEYKLDHKDMNIFSPQIEVFSPFAAHVDASRTNMTAKQMLQVVTSVYNDIPFILNKNYRSMTDINSPFVEYAADDGSILYSGNQFLIIYYTNLQKILPYYIPDGKKLVNNALRLRYHIGSTDSKKDFKKGETLFDYTGQTLNNHVPKIGYRAKIMFAQFYGYTADDAFVMKKSFAEKTKITYYDKLFIPITKEIRHLKNDSGRYFYNVGEKASKIFSEYIKIDKSDDPIVEIANTTEKRSKHYSKSINTIPGGIVAKIKVHKLNNKKSFNELESEYIYTRGLIEEIYEIYKLQTSVKSDIFNTLKAVLTEDQSVDFTNKLFSQWESATKLPTDIMKDLVTEFKINPELVDIVLEIELLTDVPSTRGDKFANTYAGKGVCSLIIPDELMPGDADIIFNPLGSFGRNNWGTMFELGMSKIIRDMENYVHNDNVYEFLKRLDFVNEHFVKITDQAYYTKILELISSLNNPSFWNIFKLDVKKSGGLYLFADTFPGIKFKDFVKYFLKLYETRFNINIVKKESVVYSAELMQWMRDRGFISSAFGSDIVEDIEQQVFLGENYWVKLYHTSESKYNSVGFAKNYSIQTGDPDRGAKKKGGQHFSWQSESAWQGHKKDTAVTKELYGVKSSAVKDKNNFILKMTKDGKYFMKPTYSSPTTTTLNCYLSMLLMRFEGFDTTYIDDTHITEIQDEELISIEEDVLYLTTPDNIIDDSADKSDGFVAYFEDDENIEEEETIDEEEDDEAEFTLDDLFEVGLINDIKKDSIGLEDDLGE